MLIQAAVSFGTVIMFGSAGEILTEKSGNLNLGVPGMMYLGGIASLAGSFFYERACDAAGKVYVPLQRQQRADSFSAFSQQRCARIKTSRV